MNFCLYDYARKKSRMNCTRVIFSPEYTPNAQRSVEDRPSSVVQSYQSLACTPLREYPLLLLQLPPRVHQLSVVLIHIVLQILPQIKIWRVQVQWMRCPVWRHTSCGSIFPEIAHSANEVNGHHSDDIQGLIKMASASSKTGQTPTHHIAPFTGRQIDFRKGCSSGRGHLIHRTWTPQDFIYWGIWRIMYVKRILRQLVNSRLQL